nr:MAG TPA: hypothetical protein [Bacteriophage sp.]
MNQLSSTRSTRIARLSRLASLDQSFDQLDWSFE